MLVSLIGTGMDGAKTLTGEAQSAIAAADVLIGAQRMLEPFRALGKPVFQSWKPAEIAAFLEKSPYRSAAVLLSGDCGFYSGAEQLRPALAGHTVQTICGVASPVYFCAKIQKPWQEMTFLNCHGAQSNVVRPVCRSRYCFFLLGGRMTPQSICRRLCDYGMGSVRVFIGENLAYPTERIHCGTAAEFISLQCAPLSVLVTENPGWERGFPGGIPDERFHRGAVPMTKSEVRSVLLAKLDVGRKDVCWDIGCGTGAVSVEMALRCDCGTVYAVDRSAAAVRLTQTNGMAFGCDNLTVHPGTAPDCLPELPPPDKVFIGGSCGKIEPILDVVFAKNPGATVALTAISLETLEAARSALHRCGVEAPEIVQLSVARAKKAGSHTMLLGENPIFLMKGERPCAGS